MKSLEISCLSMSWWIGVGRDGGSALAKRDLGVHSLQHVSFPSENGSAPQLDPRQISFLNSSQLWSQKPKYLTTCLRGVLIEIRSLHLFNCGGPLATHSIARKSAAPQLRDFAFAKDSQISQRDSYT